MFRYTYLTFDQCVKDRNELQRKLQIPVDEEESKRMCKTLYILFFNNL